MSIWLEDSTDPSAGYKVYKNVAMDLKVTVFDRGDKSSFFVNYKGYNVGDIMLFWGIGDFVALYSITILGVEGTTDNDTCLVVDKAHEQHFLDDVYYFLFDNNIDGSLREMFKVSE